MKAIPSFIVLSSLVLAGTAAMAQASNPMPGMDMSAMSHSASQASQGSEPTEGEVRKVDAATQKLTIKHGEIKNLGMPGMTMVFKVSDPKMLTSVKEGDKVRFTADRVNGALTVTSIEPVGK